jgi:hypothetical protein
MQRLPLVSTAIFGVAVFVACGRHDAHDSGAIGTSGTSGSSAAEPSNNYREVTIPAGTILTVALDDRVGSATSRIDEPVHAHLTRPVTVEGAAVVPEGSNVTGEVIEAVRSAKVKGRARLAVRFDTLRLPDDGETYAMRTSAIVREARGTKKKDALKIGVPAAAGALLGGIFGGGKGVALGSAIGAGGGAAYVMTHRGPEVALNRGAVVSIRLLDPIRVRASGRMKGPRYDPEE